MRIVVELHPDDQPTPTLRRLVNTLTRVAPPRTPVTVTRSHIPRPTLRSVVADFLVMGDPVSKQRPQFGRGKVYTPRRTVEAEAAIAEAFDAATRAHRPHPHDRYAVQMAFHKTGHKLGDVDNMVKTVLDGLNGRAWIDDRSVHWIEALRGFGAKVPHTRVTVYRLDPEPEPP